MQPLPFGRYVLVRRLANDGPELVCLDPAGGKLIWTSKPDDYVASDPLVVDEKPLVLTASHDGTGKISVFLAELNAYAAGCGAASRWPSSATPPVARWRARWRPTRTGSWPRWPAASWALIRRGGCTGSAARPGPRRPAWITSAVASGSSSATTGR